MHKYAKYLRCFPYQILAVYREPFNPSPHPVDNVENSKKQIYIVWEEAKNVRDSYCGCVGKKGGLGDGVEKWRINAGGGKT